MKELLLKDKKLATVSKGVLSSSFGFIVPVEFIRSGLLERGKKYDIRVILKK